MRNLLSQAITQSAIECSDFIVLSGDHGYALFDSIREKRPEQFVNVGVAEQSMVGLSAGLARVGFRPLVYGLCAFVPIRVLEQIKLDVCFSDLPVIFVGDGAGLVYSTLGVSHQCAEDIACLRPLPNIKIFSPCDAEELRVCFEEARAYEGPSYLRVGKGDRPAVNSPHTLSSTKPHFTHSDPAQKNSVVFMGTGSMVAPGTDAARNLGVSFISVPRIKPFPKEIFSLISGFGKVCVLEEHSRYGGLTSALLDGLVESELDVPKIKAFCLKEKFSHRCGSYQYALSEHEMSDSQIQERLASEIISD